jgi:hypothetical protein
MGFVYLGPSFIGENFLYVFKAGLTARTALPVYGLPAYDRGA